MRRKTNSVRRNGGLYDFPLFGWYPCPVRASPKPALSLHRLFGAFLISLLQRLVLGISPTPFTKNGVPLLKSPKVSVSTAFIVLGEGKPLDDALLML